MINRQVKNELYMLYRKFLLSLNIKRCRYYEYKMEEDRKLRDMKYALVKKATGYVGGNLYAFNTALNILSASGEDMESPEGQRIIEEVKKKAFDKVEKSNVVAYRKSLEEKAAAMGGSDGRWIPLKDADSEEDLIKESGFWDKGQKTEYETVAARASRKVPGYTFEDINRDAQPY